jgi:hypothetical protein
VFAKSLADEVAKMKAAFDPKGRVGSTDTCNSIKNDLPGPFRSLDGAPTDPANINPFDYADLDRTLFKLRLILEFVNLREGRANTEFRDKLDKHREELLGYLSLDSLDKCFAARDLISQMQTDAFSEDVDAELRGDPIQLSIEADRGEIRVYEPVKFYASFYRKVLNSGEVRRGWICSWDFGDDLHEKGWSVSHYYPVPGIYTVTVTFQHPEGHVIRDAKGEPLKKEMKFQIKAAQAEKIGARARLEGVRLGVALFGAIVALMAGAHEQLMKLDVFAGFIAVFLLGFGADTIKNLLTQRQNG